MPAVAGKALTPCTATIAFTRCWQLLTSWRSPARLTSETTNLIDGKALGLMKPTAHLVNVARGPCRG